MLPVAPSPSLPPLHILLSRHRQTPPAPWYAPPPPPFHPLYSALRCSYGLASLDEMCYGFLVVYDASSNATSSSAATSSNSSATSSAADGIELNYCVSAGYSMDALEGNALICTSVAERNAFEAALGRKDMLTLFKLVGAGALQLEATTGVSSAPNGTGVPWLEPQCRQKQG